MEEIFVEKVWSILRWFLILPAVVITYLLVFKLADFLYLHFPKLIHFAGLDYAWIPYVIIGLFGGMLSLLAGGQLAPSPYKTMVGGILLVAMMLLYGAMFMQESNRNESTYVPGIIASIIGNIGAFFELRKEDADNRPIS